MPIADRKESMKLKGRVNVEINLSSKIIDEKQSQDSIEGIVKQYPDMLITRPKVQSQKISFDVTSPTEDTLDPADIQSRVCQYLSTYQFPFKLDNINVKTEES
jgi:hypothetical protein